MNDTLIIVICIFLMSFLWNFYFKNLKEGVDNIDNYVMPISFSDNKSTDPRRDESKTINVPGQINSTGDIKLMKNTNIDGALNVKNNLDIGGPLDVTGETNLRNKLTVKGDTTLNGNINGEIKIPMHVPIHFGVGQNKEVNAGKISYGSYNLNDTLSIVGGGNGSRKVKIWDNLIVGNNLDVNERITTKNLTVNGTTDIPNLQINGTANIVGIQMGTVSRGAINNGTITFNPRFKDGSTVFVFITKSANDTSADMVTYTAYNATSKGFSYRQAATYQGSNWAYVTHWSSYPFNWIAFAIQ